MAPAGRKSTWLSLFYLTYSGKHKCLLLSEQQSIWLCFQVSSTAAIRKEPLSLEEMQQGVGDLYHIASGSWEQGQRWGNPRGRKRDGGVQDAPKRRPLGEKAETCRVFTSHPGRMLCRLASDNVFAACPPASSLGVKYVTEIRLRPHVPSGEGEQAV